MDNRATSSVCRGILLDMTHAASHKHENEVEWFWHQKRRLVNCIFSSTGSMAKKVFEKNMYSVERPGT